MAAFADHVTCGALALLVACGGAPAPSAQEPSPSTDRDPPSWVPTGASEGHTGEPVAISLSGGAEQARALVVALVLAIRDGNETAIEAALADRVAHAQSAMAWASWTRSQLARQMIAAAAVSHVELDTPFDALVNPATLSVVDAATYFEGPVPAGVESSDQVVSFTPTALGRHLLAGLGSSALVVRPGPTPRVVAR